MDAYSLCGKWNEVTLCKDFELMQNLAITTLDSADGPNLLCYLCFARNIGRATGGDRYKILLLNFEAAGYS